jgi:hypothetical protein
MYIYNLCKACLSRLTADHVLFKWLTLRQSADFNDHILDRRQIQDSYIFCVGLCLVQYWRHFRGFE